MAASTMNGKTMPPVRSKSASFFTSQARKAHPVLLDHRTKCVTPLHLARSVDLSRSLMTAAMTSSLSSIRTYIGQQPGSELFATIVVDAESHGQLDEVGFVNCFCASADESTMTVPRGLRRA
jgi:hypothetical protein